MKENIFDSIKKSKKYKNVNDQLIERFCENELPKFKKVKDAELSARKNIHSQVEMFFDDFNRSLGIIRESREESFTTQFWEELVLRHFSTRERIDFSKEFYSDLSGFIKDGSCVLDLGCGFNPVALYLNINNVGIKKYLCCDAQNDCIEILNKFFEIFNISGEAFSCDLLNFSCDTDIDIVLLFKILPLLEQQKKGFSKELLSKLNTKLFVITFPTRTMGKNNVGMCKTYCEFMNDLSEQLDLTKIFEKEYNNEILFVFQK